MYVIISPHCDDELIGCYLLIKRGLVSKVIYVDSTPERLEYAKKASEGLGFSIDTIEFKNLYAYLGKNQSYIYLVPDTTDAHPLHRAINAIAKFSGCRLGYYSVDMVASFIRELPKEIQEEKRKVLNRFYPDQASLWENNWKYFLFEGIVYDALTTPIAM